MFVMDNFTWQNDSELLLAENSYYGSFKDGIKIESKWAVTKVEIFISKQYFVDLLFMHLFVVIKMKI